MTKRTNASRVILDWRRLLGFDQASGADGAASAATLSPKIGPKDARGFSTYGSLGAKIGPKTARGFGRCAAAVGAKVGQTDFLGRLPAGISAKVGFKDV